MSLASTTPARSARAALAVVLAVAGLSCVDGDPMGTGRSVSIGITPSFQVLPTDFPSGPIDGIRLTALEASSLEVVGSATVAVNPSASEWAVDLAVDLAGASSITILVEVELTSGAVVEWSGRLGPITVGSSLGGGEIHEVAVFRGPLDNLDVESVTIVDPPGPMLVGASVGLGATVQLVAGSEAQPSVFWVSLDPAVATVTAGLDGALVLGVGPGIATIAVGAGPAVDEVEIEVLPRVQSVDVAPATASVEGLGVQVSYEATVTDGFGEPAPEEPVSWSSSDPAVATVDADGLVTTVGFGMVRIRATAAGVTGEGILTVRGPDLVLTEFIVRPDAVEEIVDFVATGFDVTVSNQGAMLALATTLGIRVLDATLGIEVHPTLEFAIPQLNPGESHSFTATPEGQAQLVELPSLLRFEAVADLEGIVDEQDETNNIATSADIGVAPPLFTKTWLGGAVGAPNDWDTAENWGPAGVPTASDRVFVQSVANAPVLSSSATVAVLELGDAMTVDLAGFGLSVSGALRAVGGGVVNGVVTITGAEGALEGTVDGLVMAAGRSLSGPLFVGGDLTVSGGDLTIELNTLSVGGDFTVTGPNSRLLMNDQSSVLDVAGAATFDGGPLTTELSGGTIFVGGDFTATASSNTSFVAQGTHTVVLDGNAARVVTFSAPGTQLQRFRHLDVVSAGGVTFASDVVVMGALFVDPDVSLDAADDVVSVGGSFAVSGVSSLQELNVVGNLASIDPVLDADVRVSAGFTLPSDVTINGNLYVENDLTLSGNRALVNGNFFTAGPGQLVMTNAADTLDVGGNVTFAGGSEVGLLTDGFLRLTGNFTASGSTSAFAGTGNHTVVFVDGGTQLVSFSSPGVSQQRFQNLTVENFTGDVALLSVAVVTGTFSSNDVQLTRASPGALLDLRGIAEILFTQFVGLPVALTSSSGGPSHQFDFVTFSQMDPADVQLRIELPGLGVNFPVLLTDMTFDSPDFTTGAHLEAVRGSGADVLVVELLNPTPANGFFIANSGTQVIW